MKSSFVLYARYFIPVIILTTLLSWISHKKKGEREFYQLTIYRYATAAQEKMLDSYFEQALLPALHRMNIPQVGMFKSKTNDTAAVKSLYVLMPVKSLDRINTISEKLDADAVYQSAGADYISAPYTKPPYTRMEIILLEAFPLATQMQLPVLKSQKKQRVYELRSYESYTEKIYKNKVQMFNEGDEIGLFKRLNFNAVFYGEVIAGSRMPNLMYMTCFENMADRDAHWKSFVEDPQWKKLSAMPEYQKNVSRNEITFLYPADYSDF